MKSEHQDLVNPPHYSAGITAGSLLIHESRTVASLLLNGVEPDEIKSRIISENLFHKRSPQTSKRLCLLILGRLSLVNRKFWLMISDGPQPLTKQALLACSIKHSRLLGDFMRDVLVRRAKTHDDQLHHGDWERFFETCELIDPEVSKLKESTRKKLRQVVIRILIESGYIENHRSLKLTPTMIEPDIRKLLVENQEKYVLKCMEVYE